MHQFNPEAARAQARAPVAYDQFDEFVYRSQHIGGGPPPGSQPHFGQPLQYPPPEVNIEVPSDSDSSRRPSKASFTTLSDGLSTGEPSPRPSISGPSGGDVGGGGGLPYVSYGARSPGDGPSAPNTGPQGTAAGQPRRGSICAKVQQKKSPSATGSRRASMIPSSQGGMTTGSLLAARPVLDRRSSHTGVLGLPRSAGPSRGHTPRSSHSPRRESGATPMLLGVPRRRSRGASLPGSMQGELDQEDIYRLRNFSLAGRKVVNRGDSLKARSSHSINSTGSR